ncbi:glycosyltransferase family 4 protein [Streptomyces lasiicapitis]|uniref:glycosyltransferase family 4 protein n=1 Tax=Streptomyces lasiicapitis TaxID=1923961 RepID=UPI00368F00EC
MKIAFLLHNAYGIGGAIRSTANLSAALAVRHDVEVMSVHKVAEETSLPFDPRVRLRSLIDMREDSPSYEGAHELTATGNSMFPEKGVDFGRLRYTALHDRRIAAYLEQTDADVVIATRPILNGYLARHGQRRSRRGGHLRIGQEHLSYDAHSDQLRTDQNAAIAAGLDAFVTVSEADAALYRAALPDVRARLLCIPNGVTVPAVEPSPLNSKLIVAAGRLVAVKRYDRLINAFAKVSAEHPDWTLRIYGRGPEAPRLRRQIDELGLYNQAFLMGPAAPIETEWAKGAVAAVSSDMESFGMTIVEAMHCGVPVVATDCPHGPAEIISHGEDGVLVPLSGGVDAYASALSSLIADAGLRTRLGAAARAKAATYAPSEIAGRYEELIGELADGAWSDEKGGAQGSRARRTSTSGSRRTPTSGSRRTSAPQGRRTTEQPRGGRITTRLRAALGRPRPPAPTATTALPQSPPRPTASARVTPNGSVAIRLTHGTLPEGPLDVVLRRRKDPAHRGITLPVPPPTPLAPRVVETIATLDRTADHTLPEGRWDCYVVPRGTTDRHRLRAELVETAALLTLPPTTTPQGMSAWIPYTTSDGYLALRTWLRPAHAEVDHILISETSATVTATLLGTTQLPPEGATVTATSRSTDPTHDFTMPIRVLEPTKFQFTIPYAEALARRHTTAPDPTFWDLHLHLHPALTASPIPIGRVTGDQVERKKPDTRPSRDLPHPTHGPTRIKPYYTATNDLALSARTVQPPKQGPTPHP